MSTDSPNWRPANSTQTNKIVTLGIKPDYPETGYGYIQIGEKLETMELDHPAYEVADFKEKPTLEVAQSYLSWGDYFWNAGMFIFKAGHMLSQIQEHCPELYEGLMRLRDHLGDREGEAFRQAFEALPKIPIDIAVMERSSDVIAIPCDIGWSDVGSYSTLHELHRKSEDDNVCIGLSGKDLTAVSSAGNLVISKGAGKKVGLVGVHGLMVVQTDDYLMIGDLEDCQRVKELVEE